MCHFFQIGIQTLFFAFSWCLFICFGVKTVLLYFLFHVYAVLVSSEKKVTPDRRINILLSSICFIHTLFCLSKHIVLFEQTLLVSSNLMLTALIMDQQSTSGIVLSFLTAMYIVFTWVMYIVFTLVMYIVFTYLNVCGSLLAAMYIVLTYSDVDHSLLTLMYMVFSLASCFRRKPEVLS